MVDGQLLINIIFGCGPSGHQNMRMGGEGVMGAGDYLHLSRKNKDWNVKICLFNKKYWRQVPNISHYLFESVELSTLVLIHTKQCLVHNYFIFQNMYILCKFKFKFSIVCFTVYPIFWDILVSTHEGVKTMYIFFTPALCKVVYTSCVSFKNCQAYAFFGRSTHTLDLPSLVEKKHLGYWNTLQYVPSGRGGGYLARIFHFGELPFLTNSPVCQHV